MPKKCIICNEKAEYKIKDTPDFYCQECAEENFSDVSVLVKVEEEARKLHQKLKSALKEKSGGDDDEDNGDDDNNDTDNNDSSESDEKNKDNEESEDDGESKDDEDVPSS